MKFMIKIATLLLICCFSLNLIAQIVTDPIDGPGFTTQNIIFRSGNTALSGTLFKPEHPFASVVIVHGSGQETRMLELAALLANNDIAVLTYDKRGVGKSGGVYAGPEVGTNNIDSVNLHLLASDAGAAVKALVKQVAHHGTIGLLGFSQAGWIIPLAANKNARVKFMVMFSCPVVNTLEQLRFQFYTQGNPGFWDSHTEADARQHIRTDPDRYKFAATDPKQALEKLHIPGLWLYGGKDAQIPVGLSVEHLESLKTKERPYEYRLFPELGHNTAFAKSQEPLNTAIKWMKSISRSKK